ncbi:hypothetical protein, partial [uncultured Microbacterium sp.]
VRYLDKNGKALERNPDNPRLVPAGATAVENIGVSVDWSKQGWNLDKATSTLSGTCKPGTPAS